MLKGFFKTTTITLSAMMFFSGWQLDVQAAGISSVLPGSGINVALNSLETPLLDVSELETSGVKEEEEESFENLVIAQARDYLNVRSTPSQKGTVIGKFYDDAAGVILSEQEGWYEIQSGNVTGFVKAEHCIVGEEALKMVTEVGTRMACVECDRLLVRQDASVDSVILGMVAMGDELVVLEETDGWVKVDIEEGYGWVSGEYVKVYTEFVRAESKEEEIARLEKEAEDRENARKTAAKLTISGVEVTEDNEMGIAVAEYAVQFIGNPYVWGGTDLTKGADCSGFVLKVYEHFGVELPHSSAADRKQGYAVKSLEDAQPGDLICYSGHVALYIGDGQIVHAANEEDGIKVSEADYRKILAIRRIY